jgi:plasmid maintenance system antidote protein VapI
MKKTAWIWAFLVCFMSCQSFEGGYFYKVGKKEKEKEKPVAEENGKIDNETEKLTGEIDRLTVEIDKLRKVNNEGVAKTGQEKESPSQSVSEKIPVTAKIVEFISKNYGTSSGLKFYLSRAFILKETSQKENTEIEIIDNKIKLNKLNPANEKPITFSIDIEGILAGPPGADGRELKIFFKEQDKQDKILLFKRNGQQNRYELYSIIKDNRAHPINFSEPIQLYLGGVDERDPEVKVASADFEYSDNQPPRDYGYNKVQASYQNTSNYNDNYAHNVSYNNASYNSSANPSRKVMSSGSISPARVKEYVRTKKNLTNRDIAIIDKYFEEARIEGVNADIAIAQMLYWTNNMRNNERVSSCNYGGLSPLPQRNFYGSFSSITEGVSAHIQHLKGYANVAPNQKIVDPRYYLAVERGFNGITFDQVYRSWSVNSRYGQEIDYILRDLSR